MQKRIAAMRLICPESQVREAPAGPKNQIIEAFVGNPRMTLPVNS